MKFAIGLIVILLGTFLGIYVGFWLCFIGGLVEVIEQIKVGPDSLTLAFGIAKIFLSIIWFLLFAILSYQGTVLMKE